MDTQLYARLVVRQILSMRGWGPGKAPKSVCDDVFALLVKHTDRYVRGFRTDENPVTVARDIQNAEWNS